MGRWKSGAEESSLMMESPKSPGAAMMPPALIPARSWHVQEIPCYLRYSSQCKGTASCFCIGVIHAVYAGLYSVFERSVGLIEEAVVVFNERTAAKGKFIGGFSEVFALLPRGFSADMRMGPFSIPQSSRIPCRPNFGPG